MKTKRKPNLVFLACLVGVVGAAAAAVYVIHKVQVKRNLGAILDQARRFEADDQTEKAIGRLALYVNHRPQDGEAWARLARLRERTIPQGRSRGLVYETYIRAVQLNPDDAGLKREAVDLALELKRFSDARRLLEELYKNVGGQGGSADPTQAAELEDLLGQCDVGESQAGSARGFFQKAIAHDPARVPAYVRLARLLRDSYKDAGEADKVIDAMIEANPNSGQAYLEKWRYHGPTAEDQDVARALELEPDDPDVLLAAAQAATRRNDRAEARRLLDHGLERNPQNPAFHALLASVLAQDNQLDQAEAALRRGIEAIPTDPQLPFLLADLLISRNKLAGPGNAEEWINRLRTRNLRDGLLTYLEARTLVVQRKYKQAIPKLNTARALLASESVYPGRLNLMLAECLEELGDDEPRLTALRQAAASPEPATRSSALAALGLALENAGLFEEASQQFVVLSKEHPAAAVDVARVAVKETRRLPRGRRNWGEAERRIAEAEKAVPGAPVEPALLRADLYSAREEFEKARQVLDSALKGNPKDVRLWIALAGVLGTQRQWAEARQALDQAQRDLGASADLTLARINLCARQEDAEAKRELAGLGDAIAGFPADIRVRLLDALGSAWLRLGDAERAGRAWRDLTRVEPDNRRALSRLCDLAIDAGDSAEARRIVDRLRQGEGEDGTLWRYALVCVLIDEARRGETKALDQEVPQLIGEIAIRRGDWWGVSALKARAAEARDRLQDAVTYYLEAIKRGNNQLGMAHHTLALLYRMQRYDLVDTVVRTLASRGVEPEDLKLATVLNALRAREFDRAVAIARETVPEASANPFDHITLGEIYEAAGKTPQAEEEFRRALALGPKVPAAWLTWVRFLMRANRTDQARAAIEEARKALPRDAAALTLAQCQVLVGDTAQAEKNFEAALAVRPDDPEVLRRAAAFHMGQKQNAKAEPLLTRLLEPSTAATEADQAWARRSLGLLKIQPGSTAGLDKALKAIDENLRRNPGSFEDVQARSLLLAVTPSRRSEAIRDLETRDRNGSLDPRQRFILALLYLVENDRESSERQLQTLLSLSAYRRDPNALAVMVRVQLDLGHLAEAEQWLTELKKRKAMDPQLLGLEAGLLRAQNREGELRAVLHLYQDNHPDQIGVLATMYDRFDFAREAEDAYRKAVAGHPEEPGNLVRLIDFLGRRRRAGEAIDLWKTSRQTLSPELAADAGVTVATLPEASESQRQEVETWLADTIKAHPRNRVLRLKLAYLRTREGRVEEAESLYRQILAESPNEPEALNNLAALVAYHDEAREEALDLVNQAIAIAGNVPALLDTRALVFIRTNQPERALDDLSKAMSAAPDNPVFPYHLARAHDLLGKHEEALKALQHAQRLGLSPAAIDFVERDDYQRLIQKILNK